MFSLVESKIWNHGKRRKWQIISRTDSICHVSQENLGGGRMDRPGQDEDIGKGSVFIDKGGVE